MMALGSCVLHRYLHCTSLTETRTHVDFQSMPGEGPSVAAMRTLLLDKPKQIQKQPYFSNEEMQSECELTLNTSSPFIGPQSVQAVGKIHHTNSTLHDAS